MVPPRTDAPEFHDLDVVSVSRDALCARGNQDDVSDLLCAEPRAPIDSIVALRQLFRFAGARPIGSEAMVTHSTSLFGRHVTPINPRMIYLRGRQHEGGPDGPLLSMAFTRGSPLVELVARDRVSNALRFYLLRFEPACGDHCTIAEQLTPATESGWTNVWFAQDDELENTSLDCLRCHQPMGPGTTKMLRIHELRRPWTHWAEIGVNSLAGGTLFDEFKASRPGDEVFAGLPIANLSPLTSELEALVDGEGFGGQPQLFDSAQIEATPDTWKALYQQALDTRQMPVPVRDLRATDPARQLAASQRYLDVATGARPKSELLDTRALMTVEAERSVRVRPSAGAAGEQMLVEVCGACHNSRLNHSISRARFNVDRLKEQRDTGENDVAISRLKLPLTDRLHMPPEMAGEFTEAELEAAISALEH